MGCQGSKAAVPPSNASLRDENEIQKEDAQTVEACKDDQAPDEGNEVAQENPDEAENNSNIHNCSNFAVNEDSDEKVQLVYHTEHADHVDELPIINGRSDGEDVVAENFTNQNATPDLDEEVIHENHEASTNQNASPDLDEEVIHEKFTNQNATPDLEVLISTNAQLYCNMQVSSRASSLSNAEPASEEGKMSVPLSCIQNDNEVVRSHF